MEAATAWIDEQDRATVETSGQWVRGSRADAHALALDEEAVRVRYAAIGVRLAEKKHEFADRYGGYSPQVECFGDQSTCSLWLVPRRVNCWSPQRHRATVTARLGSTSDGD